MSSAEPLTPDIETGNASILEAANVKLPPEPELKGPLKPIAETTPKERLAAIIAIAAVVTALIAIIIEQSAIVILAGILSSLMGPYAYYQQTRLTDIATLKETAARVKFEVDRLNEENDKLGENIDELEGTISDLQDTEEALEVISNTQGQSISALEKQVEANKEILKSMKAGRKTQILQMVLQIIERSDNDEDFQISEDEATKVISGLQSIAGLKLHEDRFRAAITGKELDCVMDVIQNLLREDIPEDEKIFELAE